MNILKSTALAATAALVLVPGFVAAQQNGLVNVDVSNIRVELEDIIADNNLNVQIPVSAIVQIPIGLAANVCGTTVAVLGEATGDTAQCTAMAENTNQGEAMAIARALQRQ